VWLLKLCYVDSDTRSQQDKAQALREAHVLLVASLRVWTLAADLCRTVLHVLAHPPLPFALACRPSPSCCSGQCCRGCTGTAAAGGAQVSTQQTASTQVRELVSNSQDCSMLP
jgi:hypothetical protein